MLYEQYRCGPADVVVVSVDGLIAVPAFLHSPSAPFAPCDRIHRCPPMASCSPPAPRSPLAPRTHSHPGELVAGFGGGWMGGVVGGIVLIWRGVTTPVTTPNHSDPSFYCLPCKEESRGGFTHVACSPVRVVGSDRVRGPLTR